MQAGELDAPLGPRRELPEVGLLAVRERLDERRVQLTAGGSLRLPGHSVQRHYGLTRARRAGQPGGTGVRARDQEFLFGIQEGHPVVERPSQRRRTLRREDFRPIEQGEIRCLRRRFLDLQQLVLPGRLVRDGVRDGLDAGGLQLPMPCADHPIELARPGDSEPAVAPKSDLAGDEEHDLRIVGDDLLPPELQSAESRLDMAADAVELGGHVLGEPEREKPGAADQQRMGMVGGHRIPVDEQVASRFGQRLGEKRALIRGTTGDASERVRDTRKPGVHGVPLPVHTYPAFDGKDAVPRRERTESIRGQPLSNGTFRPPDCCRSVTRKCCAPASFPASRCDAGR